MFFSSLKPWSLFILLQFNPLEMNDKSLLDGELVYTQRLSSYLLLTISLVYESWLEQDHLRLWHTQACQSGKTRLGLFIGTNAGRRIAIRGVSSYGRSTCAVADAAADRAGKSLCQITVAQAAVASTGTM